MSFLAHAPCFFSAVTTAGARASDVRNTTATTTTTTTTTVEGRELVRD
ncbi:hypothetical protein FHW69_002613 [Luteibacter sp. Sphag1AF]|nr:hypothetical protein [Luteibacter sp. Sphag1AF]MBB3227981.1 hypothetical protein [Luteibacter sp. Sphag1AF]